MLLDIFTCAYVCWKWEPDCPMHLGSYGGTWICKSNSVACISPFLLQMLLNMNFSSRTTSMDVQRNLEANVEKRMKDTYGPPPGEGGVVYISM